MEHSLAPKIMIIGFLVFFSVVIWLVLMQVRLPIFDKMPFVLLNLIFSVQAAYAAPIIMMSQNRQSERDRLHAESDYKVNREAEKRIEMLQKRLTRVETEKIDWIISYMQRKKK